MKNKQFRAGLLISAFGFIGAFAFVGCNGGSAAATTGGATPTSTTALNGAQATKVSLTGAGSTFVNPAMMKWIDSYQTSHPDVSINYQSVGSGAGIGQYKEGTVDFGATDAPLSDADLAKMPSPPMQIPVVAGAEAISYNLPGITNPVNFSGQTIADIFLGKVKTWNDPEIAKDNPGVTLPATAITVCHRSDGSGTTYIFTDYLSSVSPAWKSGPGKGKTVQWPVGIGGKGNEGVSKDIQATAGAIGYIELAYAIETKQPYANVKNAAGKFVTPSPDSTSAAVNASLDKLTKDIRTSIVNSSGDGSYPICGMTYLLISKTPTDANKSKALADFVSWAITDGQTESSQLQYAPIPKSVSDLSTKELATLQGTSK